MRGGRNLPSAYFLIPKNYAISSEITVADGVKGSIAEAGFEPATLRV